jgi:hypothetical protein
VKIKLISLFIVCLLIIGCATLFKGTSEEVRFGSNPQRAEVWINGVLTGETPMSIKLESKKTYTIEFRKKGYGPVIKTISNKIGAGWIVLDILAGLVPVIIDAATGAWYHLDQKNVNAVLRKQQPV